MCMRMYDGQTTEHCNFHILHMFRVSAHAIIHPQPFRQFFDHTWIGCLDKPDYIGLR